MKKFVVLMLVFGVASLASATLQISVDGDPEPIDSQININPSDELILDIWTDAPITPGQGEGYWALVVDSAAGTICGGVVVNGAPDAKIYPDATALAAFSNPPDNGVFGAITLSSLPEIAVGTIYDQILFHCIGPEDAVIRLYADALTATPILVDEVTIHQPEPMTMALLGLGGLFLRRRK